MMTSQAPVQAPQAALHETAVRYVEVPKGSTGLLVNENGGLGVVHDGEGLSVAMSPPELRRFACFIFALADRLDALAAAVPPARAN